MWIDSDSSDRLRPRRPAPKPPRESLQPSSHSSWGGQWRSAECGPSTLLSPSASQRRLQSSYSPSESPNHSSTLSNHRKAINTWYRILILVKVVAVSTVLPYTLYETYSYLLPSSSSDSNFTSSNGITCCLLYYIFIYHRKKKIIRYIMSY
jgi:hypothetical protein